MKVWCIKEVESGRYVINPVGGTGAITKALLFNIKQEAKDFIKHLPKGFYKIEMCYQKY